MHNFGPLLIKLDNVTCNDEAKYKTLIHAMIGDFIQSLKNNFQSKKHVLDFSRTYIGFSSFYFINFNYSISFTDTLGGY